MYHLRKYISISVIVIAIGTMFWVSFDKELYGPNSNFPTEFTTGTANTVAELKKQIPTPFDLRILPEVGPFHWEGPRNPNQPQEEISDSYIIRGTASDPTLLLRWLNWPEEEDLTKHFTAGEIKEVTTFNSTGFVVSIYTDGSFVISYYKYYGQ